MRCLVCLRDVLDGHWMPSSLKNMRCTGVARLPLDLQVAAPRKICGALKRLRRSLFFFSFFFPLVDQGKPKTRRGLGTSESGLALIVDQSAPWLSGWLLCVIVCCTRYYDFELPAQLASLHWCFCNFGWGKRFSVPPRYAVRSEQALNRYNVWLVEQLLTSFSPYWLYRSSPIAITAPLEAVLSYTSRSNRWRWWQQVFSIGRKQLLNNYPTIFLGPMKSSEIASLLIKDPYSH